MMKHAAVRDPKISMDAKALLWLLISFVDEKREAYCSLETLRRITGWGRNRICRKRAELVREGYLERRFNRSKPGTWDGCTFWVTPKGLAEPLPARGPSE